MTDGAHGERAAEDEDMLHRRQTSGRTRAERGHRERPDATSTLIFMLFRCRNTDCETQRTAGQRHEFNICKITLVLVLKAELSSGLALKIFGS